MIHRAIKNRAGALGVSAYTIAEGIALRGPQVAKYLRTGKGLGVGNVEKVLAFLGGGVTFDADATRLSDAELAKHSLAIEHRACGTYQLRRNGECLAEGDELDCHVRARETIAQSNPSTCSGADYSCVYLIIDGLECDYNFPCSKKVLKKGD